MSNTPLSKFDYTYNAVGTIATWEQQQDSDTPTQYALGYDGADQLVSAVQSNTSTSATVSSNAYSYDPAGNRLAETTLSGVTGGQFNNLNQLTGLSSTASQTVAGTTSAAVSGLTVDAVPATITTGTNFSAAVPLPTGTNIVSVVAQPVTGAVATQRYQIVTTGTAPTALTYDANGNTLTDENGNGYQWDALNRLAKITYPSGASSLFAYDGLSRRIQIVEKNSSGTVTSTKNYLWIGQEMAEERDASNAVTKRFFPQGEQQIVSGTATPYYYTKDHLGSVRELVDGSGTIVSRLNYDPYGKTTVVSGTNLPQFQYANYYQHQASGLELTWYRAYDPNVGRWLSRDPLSGAEFSQGTNLYAYVENNFLNASDPTGMDQATLTAGWGWASQVSVGSNNGNLNISLTVGAGEGAAASYDAGNAAQPTSFGVAGNAEAGVGKIGSVGVDADKSVDIDSNDRSASVNNEAAASASVNAGPLSHSFTTGVQSNSQDGNQPRAFTAQSNTLGEAGIIGVKVNFDFPGLGWLWSDLFSSKSKCGK